MYTGFNFETGQLDFGIRRDRNFWIGLRTRDLATLVVQIILLYTLNLTDHVFFVTAYAVRHELHWLPVNRQI